MNASSRRASLIGNAAVVFALVVAAAAWFVVEDAGRRPDVGAPRWIATALLLLAFAGLCGRAVAQARRARRPATIHDGDWLVVHATQTGFAEELASRTAAALAAGAHRVATRPLATFDAATLDSARIVFFIVATYGDGEPPDRARGIARDLMQQPLDLGALRYAVLALGDRTYAKFCGFGRDLDAWLSASGARPLFERVEVDNGSPEALAVWQRRLQPWTGAGAVGRAMTPDFDPWRLVERRLANAGSLGGPAFHVVLEPTGDAALAWEAGDIAIVRLPGGEQREYSIASLPGDGRVELLVRRAIRADGEPGRGAQWLTATLEEGATTDLRIRANRGFRLDGVDPSTPLILIGNGTGIAGLRAHLKRRIAQGARRHWLFFGERQAAVDRPYAAELDAWHASGWLERVGYAFSRDQATRVHVQDRLLEEREAVAEWLAAGAVVLVCGSADGMAGGVDVALRTIAGDAAVDHYAANGRYRRDVY